MESHSLDFEFTPFEQTESPSFEIEFTPFEPIEIEKLEFYDFEIEVKELYPDAT